MVIAPHDIWTAGFKQTDLNFFLRGFPQHGRVLVEEKPYLGVIWSNTETLNETTDSPESVFILVDLDLKKA